ncbi:MAG TPA: hypothetical protein VFF06_00690 [Polyangia bacterium]|nr:hypothetical protein [Polyangia bacterium]
MVAALAGCYEPTPADKGFKCTGDNDYLCPDGLSCDRVAGLCVSRLPDMQLIPSDLGFMVDASGPVAPRSCDERVTHGAFSGLAPLTSLNTAADELSISISADGSRIFYQSSGAIMTATLSGKSAGAPTVVNIAGAPAAFRGGSVNADGSYWFAGDDGAGGPTSLFQAKGTLPNLTATAQALPTTATQQSMCAFHDPVFRDGSSANDLYIAYALGGCGTPPYIAQGASGKQLGAFFAAFPTAGFRFPSLLSGGLTMIVGGNAPTRRLFYATRPGTDQTMTDTTWVGPTALPLGGIADSASQDWQAVVSPDCSKLYLVSVRAGGVGGADLYVADIAAQ